MTWTGGTCLDIEVNPTEITSDQAALSSSYIAKDDLHLKTGRGSGSPTDYVHEEDRHIAV